MQLCAFFCNEYVKHDNQGLPQLIQHARRQRHKGLAKDVASGKQTTIKKSPDNGNVTCESAKDAITKAELIWALKSVSSHFSYSASDNMLIASAKPRSARGASHQPAFMSGCLTISHTCLPCLPGKGSLLY